MCTFITSWVYDGVEKAKLKSLLRANGFDLDEYPDSPIKVKLNAPLYFRAPKSQCDCGTDLKTGLREASQMESPEALVTRLKAKGFGDAKIARLVEEQERQDKKILRGRQNRGKGSDHSASVQEWIGLLNDLLRDQRIKAFGILIHEYSGDQTLADFEIGAKVKLKLTRLTEEDLRWLQADSPYEITLN